MAYALKTDILNEMKGLALDATTSVTGAAVVGFISEADAVIDMHLNKRYTTPVTASASLLVVKKISIDIVAYRVAKILSLKKALPIPNPNVVQEITEGSSYRESMKMLRAIRDNEMDLPGESLTDSTSSLASFHTETGNSAIVPLIEKDSQQW